MKLWIIKNKAPYWGQMIGMVVRAASEEAARTIANSKSYGEGKIWNDSNLVSCEELTTTGEEEIILDSNMD